MTHRVLIPIDESEASARAVRAVAAQVRSREVGAVHLLHVLPPTPPALLEHGGAGSAEEEAAKDADLRRRRRHWELEAEIKATPFVEAARQELIDAGMPPHRVQPHFRYAHEFREVAEKAIEEARQHGCDRVVVGRTERGWLGEVVSAHVGEQIRSKADGLSVEIVE
jgi:nucleotide-binding universal stress UspA family protein